MTSERDKLQRALGKDVEEITDNLESLSHWLLYNTFVDAFSIKELLDDSIDRLKAMQETVTKMQSLEDEGKF